MIEVLGAAGPLGLLIAGLAVGVRLLQLGWRTRQILRLAFSPPAAYRRLVPERNADIVENRGFSPARGLPESPGFDLPQSLAVWVRDHGQEEIGGAIATRMNPVLAHAVGGIVVSEESRAIGIASLNVEQDAVALLEDHARRKDLHLNLDDLSGVQWPDLVVRVEGLVELRAFSIDLSMRHTEPAFRNR